MFITCLSEEHGGTWDLVRREMHTKSYVVSVKVGYHVEKLAVEHGIILKWIIENSVGTFNGIIFLYDFVDGA